MQQVNKNNYVTIYIYNIYCYCYHFDLTNFSKFSKNWYLIIFGKYNIRLKILLSIILLIE